MRMSILLLGLAACGGGAEPATTSTTTPATPPPAMTADAQIARGGELYGASCAGCHGDSGEGGRGPRLVGEGRLPRQPREGAKRDVEFVTAADVFAWVGANMPPTAPGSLPAEDYLAILAFDLSANGVELTEPLTAEQLGAITINP
jgi:mono/diheme cytochrome c family protein